jgi:hypothetical protein
VTAFTETTPTLENFWRSIILFGLLQAAHVMSPLLAGDPLRPSIDQALTDLGLQGTLLFRDRVR